MSDDSRMDKPVHGLDDAESLDLTAQDSELNWLSLNLEEETTWKKIIDYAVLWNPKKQKGILKIMLDDQVDYRIVVKSSAELDAIANIFRNEKPVYYNVVSGSIASAWKPVREGTPQTKVSLDL